MASQFEYTMLSLEPGTKDCLYRIRRQKRVRYVTVTDPAVIPEDKRTTGVSVIAELSKLKEWGGGKWKTLLVWKDCDTVKCKTDVFPPHALSKKHVFVEYPVYNIFDLGFRNELNHRVWEVDCNGRACFLKIARFPHELPRVAREVEAYQRLRGSQLTPKFLGYAFEEEANPVVRFLVESIQGRAADIGDLEPCIEALHQLHRFLIHGDVCKYNILITPEGPKFIHFEQSIVQAKDWGSKMSAEKKLLAEKLDDQSKEGRPWTPQPK